MADRINEILDNYKAKMKMRDEEDQRKREEERSTIAIFDTKVDEMWKSTIIPTINEIKMDLRRHGYDADEPSREDIESNGYLIKIDMNMATVSFPVSRKKRKVTVKVTYHTGHMEENSNDYDPGNITPDLITNIFASVLEKLATI